MAACREQLPGRPSEHVSAPDNDAASLIEVIIPAGEVIEDHLGGGNPTPGGPTCSGTRSSRGFQGGILVRNLEERDVIVKHIVKRGWCSMHLSMIPTKRSRNHDRQERRMPLFMDVHSIEGGVSAVDVAGAHQADLQHQVAHGVNYLRYWVDEEAGRIFCLVEAPDAEAANAVHREAHGLVADEIYPVSQHS